MYLHQVFSFGRTIRLYLREGPGTKGLWNFIRGIWNGARKIETYNNWFVCTVLVFLYFWESLKKLGKSIPQKYIHISFNHTFLFGISYIGIVCDVGCWPFSLPRAGIPNGSRARSVLFQSATLVKSSTAYPTLGQKKSTGQPLVCWSTSGFA